MNYIPSTQVDSFPEPDKITSVRVTVFDFPEEKLYPSYLGPSTSKPHLRDPGSCKVPGSKTITLFQWQQQQGDYVNDNSYWCRYVVPSIPTSD